MLGKKIIICCVFVVVIVLVILTGYFIFKPIAKVGNDTVRMYEFMGYAISDKPHGLERMADDLAFEKLIKETGVSVSEEEIRKEFGYMQTKSDISYKTCRKTILYQKAIEKYASEVQVSADEARSYYESNKEHYGETEPDFAQVRNDMRMEMGVAKYEERLYQIREETKVKLLK